YVTANAIWYQPHAHGSAFFSTRPLASQWGAGGQAGAAPASVETVIRLERDTGTREASLDERMGVNDLPQTAPTPFVPQQATAVEAPQPQAVVSGDPVVAEVQEILKRLNIYTGGVDGLTGPQTRAAIETYRKMVGLSASAEIDDQLLTQLGARSRAAAGAPPLPAGSPGTDLIETSSAAPRADTMVLRIQAGLKAFGNDDITVDGVVGARTKSAILEFQSLFGLPETGEPDEALLTKMREIGLTS
ncbi:hypothetical protein GX586_15290, partial [bacterium]|nr:hypothetical protein [bacterium]